MFFNQPPRTAYDLNFSVLGIPVRVHPLFWLAGLLLGLSGNSQPIDMVFWIAAFFVSILVHELGHAFAARACGWPPAITLHGFGGLASYRPTYQSPRNQILITLAGPGAGFAFAVLILAAIRASGHVVEVDTSFRSLLPFRIERYASPQLNMLIVDLLYINIFWGLVNLLPVLPLDGGQIAREVLGLTHPREGVRQALWLSIITAGIVAVLAYTKMHDQYIAIFFAYLAYTNYTAVQASFGTGGRGGW